MMISDSRFLNPSAVLLAVAMLVAPALCSGAPPQQSEDVTVQMLQKELAKRDAIIIDLLKRVRALEAERNGASKSAETETVAAPAKKSEPTTANSAPASAPAGQTAGGGLKIDKLAAERALERSLVQEGARLLRPGEIEFYPGFTLSRYESNYPTTVQSGNNTYIGQVKSALNVYDPRADIRMGLPFNTQLEVGLPSRVVNSGLDTTVGTAVQSVTGQSGGGFGDMQVGLAVLLARAKRWRPNAVGRVVWLTGSGSGIDNNVSLGGGKPGLATQLSAYWRRDPVVFLMSGGYAHYFEGSGIRPGDNVAVSQGLALAVSPETAMTFSLDQSYMKAFRNNGAELPGTDRLSSIFNFSTSTILGRGLFLRLSAGIGLTRDSPAYQFGVSLPFRFRLR